MPRSASKSERKARRIFVVVQSHQRADRLGILLALSRADGLLEYTRHARVIARVILCSLARPTPPPDQATRADRKRAHVQIPLRVGSNWATKSGRSLPSDRHSGARRAGRGGSAGGTANPRRPIRSFAPRR